MLHGDEYVVKNDVLYGDTYVHTIIKPVDIIYTCKLYYALPILFCLFCFQHLRYLDCYIDLCLGLPCVHSSVSILK